MINYLSKINYLTIKLITCQNKLIADQKMIDDYTKIPHLQLLPYNFGTSGNILMKLFQPTCR